MVIELYSQEIWNDIRSKSHYEVANVTDAETRYRIEAGSEKKDEIIRCINEGVSRLYHRCWRYLKEDWKEYADNTTSLPDVFPVELVLAERRAIGKAEPLKEAMHTFVVEYALSKFYSDMAMQDISNKHSMLALDAEKRIEDLLYKKLPPRI